MNLAATPARHGRGPRRRGAPAIAFDRGTLQADLALAARRAGADGNAMRAGAVALLREALETARAAAARRLDLDGHGLACARALARIEDDLIAAIHGHVLAQESPSAGAAEPLAILAVGGYGRGALAPGSDIDLLFLTRADPSARTRQVIENVLYVLWDLKQKVGHATRDVAECLRQAREDMTIRTALLDARLILGEASLFAELTGRFEKEIVRRTAREFVAAKLAERDARVARAGASRYLVEPNVKEGKGGLRDLDTLFWMAKYVYRAERPEDLVDAGLFTPRELKMFARCAEFLWRVRCQLHFVAGRAEERLTFDHQRVIAGKLGYSAHAGLSAVERFMKHYFLVARDVGDLTAIVCAALEERHAKRAPIFGRLVRGLRRKRASLGDSSDFAREHDRITIARPDAFERDPVNLIRIFWLADHTGLDIQPSAAHLVTRSLKRIDAAAREDREANRLFLEILTSRNATETTLRRMNEAGALGRFIPEFGRVVAMMQFNLYHHYTVDEHLIRSVGVLADIEAGRLREEHPLVSELIATLANRTTLYVATFLHDIAKGRMRDHSEAGGEIARRLCPRLGLDAAQTENVAWLIEQHLTMSTVAQSRDLSDPRTISGFAAVVQTMERLKMLLILTVCDIRAVGPGVWNAWKGQLLRTLYWETEMVLSGGHSAIGREQRVADAREELRRALPGLSDPEFETYAARHYAAYWLKVDLARKTRHARLLRLTEVELRSLATEVETDALRGVTELTVVAPDHPRLLSIIAGACAASGANIVDAQIFTTTDGLALDTICVSRAFDLDDDELRRGRRVAAAIEKALRGEIRINEAVAARRAPRKARDGAFDRAPEVTIDNSLSSRFTVLEVSGLDRSGLLFDLTRAISDLNLNIASAHIVTYGEKAVDTFYVTDLTAGKIENATRQQMIRGRLRAVFGESPSESEPRRARRPEA